MPVLTNFQLAFLAYNAVAGLVVGLLAGFSPAFANLAIPIFAWLILAMFAFELIAGFVRTVHPATEISMLMRVAAITVSFLVCISTLSYFQSA